MPALKPTAQPPFFGAWAVRAAFVVAVFGWGVGFYGPPVFLHAVVERTGWPVGWVSLAVTLHFLTGAVVVTQLPRLHVRFGLASSTWMGSVFAALGLLAWATASQPWHLAAAALFSGMGWAPTGAAAVNAIVSPWFVRLRPSALARAYNGASIGGVVFSPLWVALIAHLGFPRAALLVGATMVACIAALARWVLVQTPQHLQQAPDGDDLDAAPRPAAVAEPLPARRPWRDRRFATLAAGMAIGLFSQIGVLAHLFGLLVPSLGAQPAGLLMGCATAAAIVARSVMARALQRPSTQPGTLRRDAMCGGYSVQLLGTALLLCAEPGDTALLILGALLFGSNIGNATSMPPIVAQAEFNAADQPRVVALIVATSQASFAFAPALFGAVLVIAGSEAFFAAAIAGQLLAMGVFALGRR